MTTAAITLRTLGLCAGVAAMSACHRVDDLWAGAQGDASGITAASADPEPEPAREGENGRRAGHEHGSRDNAASNARTAPAHSPDPANGANDESAQGERDAGAVAAAQDAGSVAPPSAPAAPQVPTRTMTAMYGWTPIYATMDTNGARLGYARAGAELQVGEQAVGTNGCPRGWYAVQAGGYVCNGPMATLERDPFRNRRPQQPDLSASMPYHYMVTWRSTPMYRWLPSEADMREAEPERFAPPPSANAGASASAASSADGGAATGGGPGAGGNAADNSANAMVLSTGPAATGSSTESGAGPSTGSGPAPAGTVAAAASASAGGDAGAHVPHTRREAIEMGVHLEDLSGDPNSPVLRRMLGGMYIAADYATASAGRTFWHSMNGGFVEARNVGNVPHAPTFHGVVIDVDHPLPIAFMASYQGWTFNVSDDHSSVSRRDRAPRLSIYQLTDDPPVNVAHVDYYRTREGFYVSAQQARVVRTTAPPPDVGPTEKWIEVNLDRQMVIAYEGPRPVYVTLASTGRTSQWSARNYETIQGEFRIRAKHIATTMDGNSAGDGPYSIEDVPWVMYFENSFALHGAFWHEGFGWVHSHGCVNLSPPDARWFFFWTEPQVPAGWHGVFASNDHPGTRVYVHYERQALGERGGPRVVPGH